MKNNTAIKDLTQGNMMRSMLLFSLPMLLGNVLQNLYNWVDSMIVGKYLGTGALAAVSVSFPIMFILISAILGFTMAASILVAQYAGAKNEVMIKRTISTTTIFLGACAIILSIIGVVFSRSFLTLVNTPADILDAANSYLVIIMAGLIFMFGYNMTSAILRGLGDSKTPTVFLIVATFLNAVLDYVFIAGVGPFPAMGVGGAALATVIAQGVSYILSVIYLDKKGHLISFRPSDMVFDKDIMMKILKLGVPSAVQQFIVSFGIMAMSSIINGFGTDVVAAFGAGSKIDSFAMLPAMSISLVASTVTGQCIGAGKKEKVKDVLKNGMLLTAILSGLTILFVFTVGRASLHLFLNDEKVINLGVTYLKIASAGYLFMGFSFVLAGILRGAGDIWANALITAFNFLVIRVPIAYVLSRMTTLGVNGIWLAFPISFFLGSAMNGAYYATGRWKQKNVIGSAEIAMAEE